MNKESAYEAMRAKATGALPPSWQSAAAAGFVPADLAVFIGRAMASDEVDNGTKGLVVVAGLYTVAGFDLFPEALIGSIGLADDSLVLLEALHRLLNDVDPLVVAKLWPGDPMMLLRLRSAIFKLREGSRRYIIRPLTSWLRQSVSRALAVAPRGAPA